MTSLGEHGTAAATQELSRPRRFDRAQHGISPESVDPGALTVLRDLQAAGYEAVLVGGCVRDLLLQLSPKDFDVATDATPEQVKAVFRRARLIGRRFRIAHVRVGREVIEVSTFRQRADEDDVTSARTRRELQDVTSARSAAGLILRDNVYGRMDEDAFRRDFTINALYYDPLTEIVIDYVDGIRDLRARQLRLIGEPRVRLREDPVRILRAVRFAARLAFEIDPRVVNAIHEVAPLIGEVAPARVFDELCKLFLLGHGEASFALLRELDLLPILFPDLRDADSVNRLVRSAMHSTDQRVESGKPVTPGFLFAVLLWDQYQAQLARWMEEERSVAEAREDASTEVLRDLAVTSSLPRRHAQFVKEMWLLQPRLEAPRPRTLDRLIAHPRFRAAYDFLVLRADAGEVDTARADWWTRFQAADAKERAQLRAALGPPKGRRRRRRGGSGA